MTSVTKFHLSVDTSFNLFSFLSDRYVSIPNDSDKSDKRYHGLLQQGLQASDKSKTAMTKGVACFYEEFGWGLLSLLFVHVDGWRTSCLKALRLLSLLSLSLGEEEVCAPSRCMTGSLHIRKVGISQSMEIGEEGG